MILACHDISKSFGESRVIKSASFHIEEKEKAALTGANGAGKSTILKIIAGEVSADSGTVTLAKEKTIGYLPQHQEMEGSRTLLEEVRQAGAYIMGLEEKMRGMEAEMKNLSGKALQTHLDTYNLLSGQFEQADGYAFQSELTGVLKGLGFCVDDYQKSVSKLSGGEKTRAALAKLLLIRPDILLLDEPTNHLDIKSVAWLETYIANYPGSVLVVSHDRYFLDRTVSKVIEIEHGETLMYQGNYTDFAGKKRILRESEMKAYINRRQEIKRQEAVIEKLRSFNREKSIRRAESREKMLEKEKALKEPVMEEKEMRFSLSPSVISGKDVLSATGLCKSFGAKLLFSDMSFEIKRGEHVALTGDNGAGKTTLLRIINGEIMADAGSFILGSKVHVGYYDQEHHMLHPGKTIFDEISDDYPKLSNTQIRNTLAMFLFTGDDVFREIKNLSGGERARVLLAKLMLSEANFLILDEPTNHLDLSSREILEQALNDYTGTVLFVSHDRYFINRTATRILDLTGAGLENYLGNYDYYLEKKAAKNPVSALIANEKSGAAGREAANKIKWQSDKESKAKERKRKNDLKKTEDEITALEEHVRALDESLSDPDVYTDSAKCQEITIERTKACKLIDSLYEKWESLESLESLED